jgi:FADH2 O2-dependent halogenase
MTTGRSERYDVAVLGAGFEGATLATILARHGHRVLILDAGAHPRFVLGESTVRHTFTMLKIIGRRFDVPEITANFAAPRRIHKRVTSACGEKRNFGFVYHRKGRHQLPDEATQFVIPSFPGGPEAHLYRQDIDAALTHLAVRYGADVRYRTPVTSVEFDAAGVTLSDAAGGEFRARFVVDASGRASALGHILGLLDEPPRLKTSTRCLFTHMIDVRPYDDLALPNGVPRFPSRLHSGTCHHIFDGGWLWVIPFNNRRGSTNPLASIGLSLDCRRHPRPANTPPEKEWSDFLARFPSVHAQFAEAKAVREWVSTDRLQYSCRAAAGERYCLMAAAHGSGFIDAIFSRGLASSAETINALAARVLAALADDDFAPERFAYVQQLMDNNLANNDKLVNSAYIAFRDFDLWSAWFRVWVLGVTLGELRLFSAYRRFTRTGDERLLPDAEEPMGLFFSNHVGFQALFERATAAVEAVEAGLKSPPDAAAEILELLARADFAPPAVRLADPAIRTVDPGHPPTALATGWWLALNAPPEIRRRPRDLI